MKIALTLLLFLSSTAGLAQHAQDNEKEVKPSARLSLRSEEPLGSNRVIETLHGLAESANKPGARFAVRICSEKPLAESLAEATLSVYGIYDYLVEVKGYDRDRIILLRANDCAGRLARYAAAELWVIPQGARLPSAVESFRRCQIRVISMGSNTGQEDRNQFKSELTRLIKILREQPGAFGVVRGYVHRGRKKQLPNISNRLNHARRILRKKGLAKTRYSVSLWPWTEDWSRDSRELSYPTVYAIELVATCNGTAGSSLQSASNDSPFSNNWPLLSNSNPATDYWHTPTAVESDHLEGLALVNEENYKCGLIDKSRSIVMPCNSNLPV